jgi:DNA-binding transcriptional ArsR family regulator
MKIEGLRTDKHSDKSDARHKTKDDSMNSNNNFLLVSLEEKSAKKIAEVINNETSRKILDKLAAKECTESELSKDLNIPISTIHYNLKQLVESRLVIVDEFHYSTKGKEVNHYKLANKYIIIAPKQENHSKFMEALQKILPLTIITAVTGGVLTILNLLQGNLFFGSSSVSEATPSLMMAKTAAPVAASYAADEAANVATDAAMRTVSDSAAGAANSAVDSSVNSELSSGSEIATEFSRPFLQSEFIAWFLIGAASVILIYFIYEMVRKKK